jgi:hypothetical protein
MPAAARRRGQPALAIRTPSRCCIRHRPLRSVQRPHLQGAADEGGPVGLRVHYGQLSPAPHNLQRPPPALPHPTPGGHLLPWWGCPCLHMPSPVEPPPGVHARPEWLPAVGRRAPGGCCEPQQLVARRPSVRMLALQVPAASATPTPSSAWSWPPGALARWVAVAPGAPSPPPPLLAGHARGWTGPPHRCRSCCVQPATTAAACPSLTLIATTAAACAPTAAHRRCRGYIVVALEHADGSACSTELADGRRMRFSGLGTGRHPAPAVQPESACTMAGGGAWVMMRNRGQQVAGARRTAWCHQQLMRACGRR